MNELVDGLYRDHAAALLARLTRTFGVEHIALVEAIVQETFEVALGVWPSRGVPEAPLAWLTAVAKNRVRDQLRRGARFAELAPEAQAWLGEEAPPTPDPVLSTGISDDLLRMMFVACHPDLPVEARLALALRTLCSFSTLDIARALLTTESAVEKRLVRARAQLRERRVSFDLPPADELLARLDPVLTVLYLLFGEGYHAHSGERIIKEELCREAIRLARILDAHPITRAPRISALLALFCLQASRLSARFDADGGLVPLAEQDRARWNGGLIAEGLVHLDAARAGTSLSAWHLQAGIAACHAIAPSFAETRWAEIVRFYDRLRVVDDSPVVALHRAIAVSHRDGPSEGLRLLDALDGEPRFRTFALLHASRADMLSRLGRREAAIEAWIRSAELAGTPAERRFIEARVAAARA
jgi:RNA polymerase sigma-70 factor (ECF subfamily)